MTISKTLRALLNLVMTIGKNLNATNSTVEENLAEKFGRSTFLLDSGELYPTIPGVWTRTDNRICIHVYERPKTAATDHVVSFDRVTLEVAGTKDRMLPLSMFPGNLVCDLKPTAVQFPDAMGYLVGERVILVTSLTDAMEEYLHTMTSAEGTLSGATPLPA